MTIRKIKTLSIFSKRFGYEYKDSVFLAASVFFLGDFKFFFLLFIYFLTKGLGKFCFSNDDTILFWIPVIKIFF